MNRGVSADQVSFYLIWLISPNIKAVKIQFLSGQHPYSMVFKKWASQQRVNWICVGTISYSIFWMQSYLHCGGIIKNRIEIQVGIWSEFETDAIISVEIWLSDSQRLKAFLNSGHIHRKGEFLRTAMQTVMLWIDDKRYIGRCVRDTAHVSHPVNVDGYGVPAGETLSLLWNTGLGNINRRGYRVETHATPECFGWNGILVLSLKVDR